MLVEVHAEQRSTQHPQRETAHVSVQVEPGTLNPTRGSFIGRRGHVTGEGRDMPLGEERLQRPSLWLPTPRRAG